MNRYMQVNFREKNTYPVSNLIKIDELISFCNRTTITLLMRNVLVGILSVVHIYNSTFLSIHIAKHEGQSYLICHCVL